MGFTLEQIRTLVKNGFKALFISDAKKKEYCKEVDRVWDEFVTANNITE